MKKNDLMWKLLPVPNSVYITYEKASVETVFLFTNGVVDTGGAKSSEGLREFSKNAKFEMSAKTVFRLTPVSTHLCFH